MRYCRAVLTTARIGNPRAADATLLVALRLRPVWAREKKNTPTSPAAHSMRRHAFRGREKLYFRYRARDAAPGPFSGAADGTHARPAESARLHLPPPRGGKEQST